MDHKAQEPNVKPSQDATPAPPAPPPSVTVDAAALVRAIKGTDETGVIRRSRQPLDANYPFDPGNYDIRAEADKLARAKGHDLSKWITADSNAADFFHAKCMDCGLMAHARWRGKPTNDKTTGQGQFPELGGEALEKTCADARGSKKAREMFSRRTSAA